MLQLNHMIGMQSFHIWRILGRRYYFIASSIPGLMPRRLEDLCFPFIDSFVEANIDNEALVNAFILDDETWGDLMDYGIRAKVEYRLRKTC
jgi:phage terminase Nu1 subunit (DNA packaging protein)